VKHKVYGNPIRLLDPFRLIKTILFLNVAVVNNIFCEELKNKIIQSTEQFKTISEYDTAKESEANAMRQKWEADDVKLNTTEIQEGRYWVNGEWIERKNEYYKRVNGGWVYEDPKSALEKSKSESINKELEINKESIAIKKPKNVATFSMEGCEPGFHFPPVSKDVLPITIIHKAMKTYDAVR